MESVLCRFVLSKCGGLQCCWLEPVGGVPSWWDRFREGGVLLVRRGECWVSLLFWAEDGRLVPWDDVRGCADIDMCVSDSDDLVEVMPLATVSELLRGVDLTRLDASAASCLAVKVPSLNELSATGCLRVIIDLVLEKLFRPITGEDPDTLYGLEVAIDDAWKGEGKALRILSASYAWGPATITEHLERAEIHNVLTIEPGPTIEIRRKEGKVLVRY